jgi:hypothetical protein
MTDLVLYDADRKGHRRCGDCQLCCRLLPTEEIAKPALKRCQHQKHGVGCAIYSRRPVSCQLWSCRWLVDETTAGLPRPDRSHYVIDIMGDYIKATSPDGTDVIEMPCVQVWVDPDYPDVHRAPSFRRWLDGQKMAAVIRYGTSEGFVLIPPSINANGEWVERHDSQVAPDVGLWQKVKDVQRVHEKFGLDAEFKPGERQMMRPRRTRSAAPPLPKWRTEFPDFPVADMPEIPPSFVDTSWHNDTCPCFSDERARLILWVDYRDPRRREVQTSTRFLLCEIDRGGSPGDVVACCEYWDDMLREIKVRTR